MTERYVYLRLLLDEDEIKDLESPDNKVQISIEGRHTTFMGYEAEVFVTNRGPEEKIQRVNANE